MVQVHARSSLEGRLLYACAFGRVCRVDLRRAVEGGMCILNSHYYFNKQHFNPLQGLDASHSFTSSQFGAAPTTPSAQINIDKPSLGP